MEEIVAAALSGFTILSNGKYQVTLCLPINAAFFAGHFPEHPIVPGVVLVEAVRQAAQLACGKKLLLNYVKQIKFKDLVGPEEAVTIDFTLIGEGENYNISAQLTSEKGLKAKLQLNVRPQ